MAPTQMVGREPDRRRNGHTSMRVLGAGVALIVTLVGGMTLGRISRGEQGAGETSPVSPTETVAEVTPAFDCRLAAHTAEFLICDHSALRDSPSSGMSATLWSTAVRQAP